jgi:hypothetical protein
MNGSAERPGTCVFAPGVTQVTACDRGHCARPQGAASCSLREGAARGVVPKTGRCERAMRLSDIFETGAVASTFAVSAGLTAP